MTNTAKKTEEKPNQPKRMVGNADLQRAEFSRAHYRIIIKDLDTTIEDILKPDYWVNVGATLAGTGNHEFPIIEIIWGDGSRYVELIVIAARNLFASVRVLRDVDLNEDNKKAARKEKEAMSQGTGYKIEWVSPTVKFSVVRESDGERLTEGLATKKEAEQWLDNLLQAS